MVADGDDTRDRIERVARDVFLERGYAGTPLRLIAEAANVSTPVIYWHFKSKDDLCFSIVARDHREFGDLVRAAVGQGPPEEQLREYVQAFVSLQLVRRAGAMKLGFDQLAASLPSTLRARLTEIQRPLFEQLRDILNSGSASGVFSVLDATVTAFAILSMANYVFTWYRPDGALSVDAVATTYADLALRLARGLWASADPDVIEASS